MKVLLISSGSVSVHVSAKVHQRLLDDGHEVMHFLTENAHTLWKQSGKWDIRPADWARTYPKITIKD